MSKIQNSGFLFLIPPSKGPFKGSYRLLAVKGSGRPPGAQLITLGTPPETRLCLSHSPHVSLAMSRSIGDGQFKHLGVTSEPDIVYGLPFQPGSALLLATGGRIF